MHPLGLRSALLLLCAAYSATFPALAADAPAAPERELHCSDTLKGGALTSTERLELIVNLAYHSLQSRQPGLRLSGPQNAVLGLVIEEACRQAPEAELGATVDLAVRIALEAQAGAADRLATH